MKLENPQCGLISGQKPQNYFFKKTIFWTFLAYKPQNKISPTKNNLHQF